MRALNQIHGIIIYCLLLGLASQEGLAQANILDSQAVSRSVRLFNLESLNTPALEFSPTVRDSQLYYVSSLNAEGEKDPEIEEPWFIWFRAPLSPNGYPQSFSGFDPFGKQPFHLGPMDFTPDGKRMFYTANSGQNGGLLGKSSELPLQLYSARKEGTEWGSPALLSFVDKTHDYCHPSWDEETGRLYFSSNRPGGFGQMDIYYVERIKEGWSQPVNAGPGINTEYNEVFPFVAMKGALFFSSDRGASLDVFLSMREAGHFNTGRRLPPPFSSERDDLGFYLDETHRSGYISSDRTGGWGKDDLYAFESDMDLLADAEKKRNWKFITLDSRTGKAVEGAEIRPFPVDGEGLVRWPGAFIETSVREHGKVYKAYRLKDPRTLREAVARTDSLGRAGFSLAGERQWKLFFTAPGYRMKEWKLPGTRTDEPVVIRMKSSGCVPYRIEVVDEKGNTLREADLKWESSCVEEQALEGEERKFLPCLYPDCKYEVIASAKGFRSDTVRIIPEAGGDTSRVRVALETKAERLPEWTGKIERGEAVVMENIYYDYNKASIRPGAAEDLEVLTRVMKRYPSMHIELIAHTDSRGDKYYNLKLSLRRAESAKKFLVERGIDADRIRALGYGESQVRNRCENGVDCTEEEHQYNRRTEVRITSIEEEVNIQYRRNLPDR